MSSKILIADALSAIFRSERVRVGERGEGRQLGIELEQGRTLTCGLQVVHVRSPKFGTKITSISPEDRERLAHLLDDHVQTSFSRR